MQGKHLSLLAACQGMQAYRGRLGRQAKWLSGLSLLTGSLDLGMPGIVPQTRAQARAQPPASELLLTVHAGCCPLAGLVAPQSSQLSHGLGPDRSYATPSRPLSDWLQKTLDHRAHRKSLSRNRTSWLGSSSLRCLIMSMALVVWPAK